MANEEELNEVEQGSQQEDAEQSAPAPAEDAPLTKTAQDSSPTPQEKPSDKGEKPADVAKWAEDELTRIINESK